MSQRMQYQTHAAEGLKRLDSLYGYVAKSELPKALVDLAFLRASQINGCAYCIDFHTRDLVNEGVPMEKLALLQVWEETSGLFTEQERAALAWTEAVTLVASTHVPDDAYKSASKAFSEKELADLTLAIGVINVYNRLAISFRRTPESLLRKAA
jgi:AhpD family alkylhydroperoxidase